MFVLLWLYRKVAAELCPCTYKITVRIASQKMRSYINLLHKTYRCYRCLWAQNKTLLLDLIQKRRGKKDLFDSHSFFFFILNWFWSLSSIHFSINCRIPLVCELRTKAGRCRLLFLFNFFCGEIPKLVRFRNVSRALITRPHTFRIPYY